MKKIDFKKDLKHLYQPSAKAVVEVDVPSMHFLLIDGEGDPNTSKAYAEAVEALFAVSYTAKFMAKKGSKPSTMASCHSRDCGGWTTWHSSQLPIKRSGSG
ncbi:MAG: hypothetical protein U0236_16530 [Nitrospira sp.]